MPELLRRYPQTREVLDRYGLRGCGGAHGPHESLDFFARTHGINERTLMDELRHTIAHSAQHTHHAHHPATAQSAPHTALQTTPRLTDAIYRWYFLGAIGVVLTAGASWGVWLLWKIGLNGDFTAASVHEVNAHGHAQIFGWVGLFIMGFALQALPRMWHVELPAPRLALASFIAMTLGIALRARRWR